MKKFVTITAFLFFGLNNLLFSQDNIILKSGEEIKAKITEIGINEVRYKKWENIEGPIYSMDKLKIFMIKYQNGTKDIFETKEGKALTEDSKKNNPVETPKSSKVRQIRFERSFFGGGFFKYADDESMLRNPGNLFNTVSRANLEFRKGNSNELLGIISDVIGLGGIIGGLLSTDKNTYYPLLSGGLILSTTGTIFHFSAMKKWENAAFYYNQSNLSYRNIRTEKAVISLKTTKNGFGLICSF